MVSGELVVRALAEVIGAKPFVLMVLAVEPPVVNLVQLAIFVVVLSAPPSLVAFRPDAVRVGASRLFVGIVG